MFTRVYNKVKRNTRRGTSFLALVSLLVSSFVALDIPQVANAAIVTNNLVVNLDGTDTSSLAATSPTVWNSIAPGLSTMSGTITNATRATGSTGGLNFVGTGTTGSYVNFGTAKGNIAGSITFDTWIKPGNLPANAWAIIASRWFDSSTSEVTANHDFHFGIRTGATSGTLQLDTSTQTAALTGTTQFPLTGANKWYHVGFVIDSVSGKAQLFVNGATDSAQATMSHSASANPQFWIGDGRLNASLAFNGTISKARLYGAALSQSDMLQNFGSDSTLFGYSPVNTTTPSLAGTAKVGSTMQTTDGSWNDTTGLTTAYKWQSSPDGTTWTDISGATSSSYTPVAGNAAYYIRSAVIKTNSNGSTTAYSAASLAVQTANGIIISNGGTLTGLTSTVPNDANIYQVTLASTNLSSTIAIPNNTGLTIVSGYSTTASYMATAFTGAPIISFRGTGTAINTALATATYTGTVAQTDTVKLYYARGTATITDTDNYIPIYDNGKLTFHYYTFVTNGTNSTWPTHQTSLQATTTMAGITSANKWYLATPRYQIEDTRIKALIGATANIFFGGYSTNGSTNWYWPANTDGFTSAVQFATGATATSTIFNGTSTVLPWQSGEPNGGSTGDRYNEYYYWNSAQGWDDVGATQTFTAYTAETYISEPMSSTGTQGILAMTVRPSSAPGAPTALSASAPGSSVTLNWVAPAATGSDAITDYVIQYSSDQTNWTTFSKNASTSTTATVTGLNASTVYSFRVAAFTTLQGTWSQIVISSNTAVTGGFKSLSGYSIPTTTTGTIRVLLVSSNAAGRLWVTNTTNIADGIRGTANYPDNNGYFPTYNYNPANINSAGQMIGLTDTSAADINTALASLRYQSPTASTDTISMWVSNGTEYVPILNGSNVEFHYYGKNTSSVNWTTARGSTGAGAAQTIDGVAANSPFLATARYRAENFYIQSIAPTGNYYLNASDDTASPVNGTEGTWKWLGADANGIQFWSGSQTGSVSNGEYNDWGFTSGTTNQLEPNGGTGENCANIGSGYANTGSTNGWAWNDVGCTATMGFIWESYNTGMPYGSNSTNPGSSNYASLVSQQAVSVSAPVAAPTGLTASSTTSGQVDLSWSAPAAVSGITSYSVQYSTDGINWTEDRSVASTATTEAITGLTTGTYYHFRVAAITASSVGIFTSTYFTPTGTGKWNTWISSANTVSGLTVDAALNSYKMSVLLYASTSTIQLGTTTNLAAIRGTANASTLTTAGQLIGFTGSGSDVNTALASLKYNSPATTGNQSITMWVSVGTTTALPQAYVPAVNTAGQVEFHYFGYSSDTGTWALAQTKAQSNSATINGQTVSGKYLATAESANQNAAIGDAMSSAAFTNGRAWLNGGDYTSVSSTTADNAWNWMGPDTGFTQFWSGTGTGGSAVNSNYYNWGASNSTTRLEPNGTNFANCLAIASPGVNTYSYSFSGGAISTTSTNGNAAWDDSGCNDGSLGYIWEYSATAPVGTSTSGANYVFLDAQSVNVNPNADSPTALSVAAAGSTALAVSWTAPASVYNGGTITGYQLQYSTSSTFATSSTLNTGSTATSALITGLTAGTTYYVRVLATGSTWQGAVSSSVSAATNATATTITVVASGGGVAGTDYTNTGGIFTAKSSTSVNVNASDLQAALLLGDVTLGADSVTVNTGITWTTSKTLTLGSSTSGTVSINGAISTSGVSGGVKITPSTYSLSVKAGGSISFTGSSPSLTIGGTNYTLIKSESELSGIATSGTFALAKPLNLTTAYTTAVANINFTGTFDGLGNTVNRMNISASTTGAYGLFANVSGSAALRNVGVTNAVIKLAALSGTYYSGMLVGRMTAGTVTFDQVWSSGLITTTGVVSTISAGGIIGNAAGGTLTISKSWSNANIDTSLSGSSTTLEQGGIIGGDEATVPQAATVTGAVVYLSQVYSNGTLKWASTMHRGIGGLFGLHYNTTSGSTITDSFSWATLSGPTGNVGGAIGVAANSSMSLTRVYQASYSICVAAGPVGFTATPSCDTQQTPGTAVTGITGGAWASNNGTTLANLPTPSTIKTLYVQPIYTANADGTFGTLTYQIVDGLGTVQNAAALTALNVSVSGTATYTIDSSVGISATPYAVDYVSGLTLGGTSASSYTLAPWFQPTSATITKFRQTVTWTPTTSVSFGSGTFTPDALPVGNGAGTISYSLSSSGITGCSVNSSTGAITYTNGGSCAITATAAANGNYVAGSTTVSFTIADPATLPTVTARGSGTGSMVVSWTTPTVSSSAAITGYTLLYSTSSNMATPTTVNIGNTNTSTFITGLATNTTYYFQVRAIGGSTWTGSYTAAVSGSTLATANTMTIAASGGATQGTGYFVNNGVVYATGNVTINASDINTLLANNSTLQLAADTVNVNAGLSWSTNAVLTLGNASSSTVNINSTIAGSGGTSGVKILPTTYALAVKSGAYIQLTGATPSFNLGGVSYTVVNTAAGLSSVSANTTWALTAPITLTGSYTAAVKDFTFTGIMDGLGNTVNNMTIVVSATKDVGFYAALGGATVRNVGFTNVNISSATDAINTRLGSVAGNGSITASVTNTVSQVWATGFINQTFGGTAKTEAGGLFGGAQTGTINITRSWSSVAISTKAYSVGSGGIIGTNVGSFNGGTYSGATLTITESYSTGNILRDLPTSPLWYGNAGIIGVAYGASTTLTNVFSWGNINSTGTSAGTSTAGISGVGAATITNAYTTHTACGGTVTNCVGSVVAGTAPSSGTGFGTGLWSTTNGASLVNLAPPTKALYVQVIAPTDGSYGTLSYQIVDSTGTAQTLSALSLTVSGTPTYTINAATAKGTYSVSYVSGLTLGGTSASVYSLSAWINSTSVTISKFPQTVTWSPTLSNVFGNGILNPSASAVSNKGTTITYSVASAGNTGCTVNASTGVITYTSAGTCTITASGDSTGDYLASTVNAAFVISAAPTITIVASGGGVSGTDYTIANGLLTASANVSVNASDLATALASGNLQLAGNVVVKDPLTWSGNSVLTLGGTTSNTVAINANVSASGNTAGLAIKPTTYSLSIKNAAAISLSGTTPTLTIGGTNYTLIKSIADLATVTASGNFALAVPLNYSSGVSASPITVSFAGTLDGLGNTINGLSITHTAAGATGLMKTLAGGTVRNLGITNMLISLEPVATTYNSNVGGLAGDTSGTVTIDQVWTTGFMRVKSGSTYAGLALGGLIGDVPSGSTTITKSWSSMNMNAWGSTYTNQAIGGLVGADVSTWPSTSATASGNITMNQVYFTGDTQSPQKTGTHGQGGILGVHLGTGTVSITDAFSWGSVWIATGDTNYGGIIGYSAGSTAYLYTSYSNTNQLHPTGSAVTASSNSSWSVAFGATPGFTTNSNWETNANGFGLVNLPLQYKNIYVRVMAPTDGSYGTMTYRMSTGIDSAYNTASLYTITGTPTYTIASNVAISATPYQVDYVSGLSFSYIGTGKNVYKISNFGFLTPVTISKYPQTVTWSPTTSVSFSSGSITPSALASASGGTTITYAVTDAGATGCTVNATTAVITATAGGNCVVTATAANAGNYLAATASVTFAIADASVAPAGVTTTPVGTGAVLVNWTAPTPAASSALTGYQVTYSTSSSMTSPTTVSTSTTSKLVTGLTANTTYYFQVRAVNGTTWYGAYSTAVTGATPSTGTTLTVAASGGTQDSTWKVLDGVVYPIGSGIINAADLQGLLQTGSVSLAADTVTISSDVTWNTSQTLALGYATTNTVKINADITASGTTGGLVIAPATYSLDTKNNAQVILSGSSTTLSIGGVNYTLIRSIAGLASVSASTNYALAQPLSFTSAITSSPISVDYAATFDGLGNTIDGMNLNIPATTGFYGFFIGLTTGATVRNLGLTNVKAVMPTGSALGIVFGVLTAHTTGTTTGTVTLNKVWTTGFVNGTAGATLSGLGVGGVMGMAQAGTTNISQTWSSVNIDVSSTTTTNVVVGGILGSDTSNFGQANTTAGGNVAISESYFTGFIKGKAASWRGWGGIMGVKFSSGTTSISDSFSTGLVTTTDTTAVGGIVGTYSGGSYTSSRNFTANPLCDALSNANCLAVGVALGATVTGANTAVWTSSGASYLVNLPAPKRNLYVQTTYTNVDGSFAGVGNQVVDGVGGVQTLSSLNLTKTGTAAYSYLSGSTPTTFDGSTSVGTYAVSYASGLTFGGTALGNYNIVPYPFTTSVAITKLAQSISYTSTAPTTAKVNTTYTPTATSSSGGTVTFTIDGSSTSICSISSGVVTFNAIGNCVINANQSGATNWLAAPQAQQTAIATVKGDQTVSFTTLVPTAAKVAGATYTPTGTSTSGGAVVFTIDSSATSVCSITGGVVSFLTPGTCIVDGDQAGNANWNAAPQQSQTFTVAKGVQTITFSSTAPTTAVVGGATYTPTATKTAGTSNAIAFSIDSSTNTVCSISAGAVSFLTVGTCKVNADVDGDSKYEAATQVQQSITVNKGSQTISFSSSAPNAAKVGGKTYTVVANAGPSTSAVVLSVDASTSSKCSVTGMVVTYLVVGDCVLNLNQAGDTNYNAAGQVQQTVTISTDGRCPNGVVSGNYCLFRFNSSGTWTVPVGVTAADMLVVGGGGAGGSGGGGHIAAGGGGGGEVIENLGTSVTPGTRFTISVGAGGVGGVGTSSSPTAGTAGGSSTLSAPGFTTITSRGGGQGATYSINAGAVLAAGTGASVAGGGGGAAQVSLYAAGIGGVSNGGSGNNHTTDGNYQTGGGGGGAGGNGSNATGTLPGAGGAGKNSVILGTLLGGGGGGAKRTSTGGSASTATAGGGAGGWGAAGTAGTANTGGGGGGSGGANDGANGGSGVVVIRVALQSQSVSFTSTAPTGVVYGTSTTYTPTVSGTASEVSPTITVDASSSSVCSIAAGVVSVIGAGTCTLNANQAGNGFYAPATQAQQSFTVAKQAQTINFSSVVPTNAKYSGSTYTVTATGGGSGNAVTFTIDSSAISVCSVTAGVVSFIGVGDCVINANQASNSNYLAASQGQQTFAVGKATPTLSFTSTASSPKVNTTYTPVATSAGSGAVTYTIDASSTSGACTISNGVVSFGAVGNCVINASQATSTNYTAATASPQTVAVVKGDQAITFGTTAPSAAVVNGATYTPTATSTSTGTVAFTIDGASSTVCSIAAGVVSFQTIGTCKVLANQAGNTNWNAATQNFQTFTVGRGSQTITFTSQAPTAAVVSGASYSPTATATGGGAVSFTIDGASSTVCSITSGSVTFQRAGTCKVLANQAGDTNWNAATQNFQTFTVGKGTPTLDFTSRASNPNVNTTYTPVASSSSTGTVSYTIDSSSALICSIAAGVVTFNAVGTCTVNASQVTDNNWLEVTLAQQSITVVKGDQTITFSSAAPTTAVVAGTNYTPTATSTSGASVTFTIDGASSAVCSITSGAVSFLTAGTCKVLADQAGNDNWNAAPQASQTISVGKGAQVVLFTSSAPTDAVVDGSTYTVVAVGGHGTASVISSIASASSSVCSISSGVVSFNAAGDCVVELNQAGDGNYNAAPQVTQTITVGKGDQVVAFTSNAPTGVRVDDSGYVPTASGGASSSAVTITVASASSQICAIANGEVSFHAVGDCVLQVNQAGDANYNGAPQVTQTITVAKGLQSITKTSTDPSAVVDGASYTPTFTSGASGNSVVVAIASGSATECLVTNGTISFIGAGDCDVTVNQAGNTNYEAAPELAFTITVGKGSQGITWTTIEPSDAVVGGTTYTPAATGGASGNAVSFRVDVNTASVCAMSMGVVRFVGVGTCTVLANQNGNNDYLSAPQISQTFTVGKGAQAISFTSAQPTAVVDGSSYTPVATGGATGNAVSFTIASASSSVCALNNGRVTFQHVGSCVIEANQAGNTNYNAAAQTTQTFNVGKGAQVISFTSNVPSAKVSGTTYAPVVSGGASGNAVTLSIADASSSICTVNNGVVSYQAVGVCVVQADQAASSDYNDATQVTQTITVTKGTQVVNFTSTPPSLRPVQGTTYVPTATSGNSGNPVVFTIDAEAASICEITNGTISFLAVGDCVLHADQAGNANFTAATRVTQIFDITKGEQIVNFTSTIPTTAVVDGSTYTPTGTGGNGTRPVTFTATQESAGICSVLVGVVYFDGSGDCVIAINQAGDTNYNAATPKFQTINVGKGSQTITFTSLNNTATVDGPTYTPTYTDGESINAVHISVASGSSNICEANAGVISFHAVGDCVIEATQAADNNYEAATLVSQTISVAKGTQAALVARASLTSLTLGTNTPTAVLNTTGGSGTGSVTWSVSAGSSAYCSVAGEIVSGLASGYCDLVATKSGDDNYLEATATLTIVVSTGGQSPVRTSVSNSAPTFAEGLTLTLALDGGNGDGAIWFESLSTHVCNTDGGTTLNIYHSGTCTVIGHKDGDDNFEAVSDTLTFEIAKAEQSGVTIHLASALTYSATGAVTSALSLEGVLAAGAQSYSVTNGTCTLVDGELSATEAGDCEVTATILGDDKYLDGTFTQTFTVAKAAQTPLTATLATEALSSIAWDGVKTTTFDVAGGSGDGELTVNTSTPLICSVELTDSVVTVTGLAQGTCEASVSRAATANYLGATTLFSVEVLDLAEAPTAVAAAAPVRASNGSLWSTVSWTAPAAASTRAGVTGVRVQSRIGNGAWADVTEVPVPASDTSLSVNVQPWTKYNFRVAATTALDGDNLNWAYFDLSGDDTPDLLIVGGGKVVVSTAKAATTSGETVIVTGAGFEEGYTNRVELTTGSAVFAAGIRPAAVLAQTVVLPATYISSTQISFVLPKITLPKGTTSLTTQIKVLSTDNLRSDAFPLEYIPKKLAQTLTANLPAANTIMTPTAPLISTGTVTSSSADNPPVVTATPASVCTASINVLNKLVVTPVSPGKCSISVVVPATPAYLVSATKTTVVYIKTNRTAGLTATADSVTSAGAHTPTTFNVTSGLSNTAVSVVIGENAVEVPVTLNKREGKVLFTVDAASDAAGRCIADGGDATTGLVGTITMNDLGTCKVTVTLPADDGYYVGTETIVITVNGVALDPTVPVVQDLGDGVASPEDTDLNPKDPDTEPAVAITLDPSRAADYSFGGEDGLAFDPLTKKLNVRSRTPLVGVWTATLTSPDVTKKWFKIPGKVVKKVQTYTYSNVCKLTLTVKKDPKLKKKVTRIVGAGCILSSATDPGFKAGTESGWTALTSVGIQKIKVKYKRIRQYAKTGLSYVKKKGNRVLKNINRTWVVKIGRRP